MTPAARRGGALWSVCAFAAGIAIGAEPALAHGSASVGEFYSGLLHPLIHFETLLPSLALGLWAVQLPAPDIARLPIAFLAAVLAGAAGAVFGVVDLPHAAIVLHAAMLLLGAGAAAALRLPILAAGPLVVIAGLAVGSLTAVEARAEVQRPLLYLLGVPVGLSLLLLYIVGYLNEYRQRWPWLRIGARVVGSWIAATGLLVLVLDIAGPRPPAPPPAASRPGHRLKVAKSSITDDSVIISSWVKSSGGHTRSTRSL